MRAMHVKVISTVKRESFTLWPIVPRLSPLAFMRKKLSHPVRILDVLEPRLLICGNLVDVHAVDEALYSREQDHHLIGDMKQKVTSHN